MKKFCPHAQDESSIMFNFIVTSIVLSFLTLSKQMAVPLWAQTMAVIWKIQKDKKHKYKSSHRTHKFNVKPQNWKQPYWLLSSETSGEHFCCLATLNVLVNGDDSKLFWHQNFLNKHGMSHYQVGAWLKSSLALTFFFITYSVFVASFLTFCGAFFWLTFCQKFHPLNLFLISRAPPHS